MYSPHVIEQEQNALERRFGLRLTRYEPEYCWEVQELLESLWSAEKGLLRKLSTDEQAFITNERLLCSIDFHYWCRYAYILPDASVSEGTLMRFEPWESQRIILLAMADLEAASYDAWRRGEPQNGVLIAEPKARQEGATMLARLVLMHRLTTSPHTLGVTATENEDKRLSLYNRDERILTNLPWWLRPERTAPDIQAERLTFGKLDSWITYQDYMQKGSLAAGEQFVVGHMSEVAQGDQAYVSGLMTMDYFPAIPQSWRVCHILESTPVGRGGWWHPFITAAVKGKGRWKVKFIPWYAVGQKYRHTPGVDWTPSQVTLEHARKVEETSAEYMGRVVTLTREQLYWWEMTRDDHVREGKLPIFLTNYPATLEESFQFSGTSIFPPEVLDHYRRNAREPGGVYQVVEQ